MARLTSLCGRPYEIAKRLITIMIMIYNGKKVDFDMHAYVDSKIIVVHRMQYNPTLLCSEASVSAVI